MKRTKKEIIEMNTYIQIQSSLTQNKLVKDILWNLQCAVNEIEEIKEDEDKL